MFGIKALPIVFFYLNTFTILSVSFMVSSKFVITTISRKRVRRRDIGSVCPMKNMAGNDCLEN